MTLFQIAILDRAAEVRKPPHLRKQPTVEELLIAAARMHD